MNLNIHKKSIKISFILAIITIGLLYPTGIYAKTEETVITERIEELDDLDFVEMINSVETGSASSLIQKFQDKEAKTKLLKGKYLPSSECNVEAFRNKEVLLITIPAHLLFDPNETDLKAGAQEYLAPIKRYLKDPDMFRVMLVMHTDNTGSDDYRDQITLERVNSVFDWFEDSGVNTTYLFSYALADSMPLPNNNNDSLIDRQKNRRLEIYLVPGTKMVEQAKKGRIAF